MSRRFAALAAVVAVALVLATAHTSAAQDRETKVRGDRERLEADERWIYNDLPRAMEVARDEDKPLLVVLRCIPCEACSRFDELVVLRDERIQELMDRFVCVRIVQANGLDLDLFQFDYDQSFHAFVMNADQTIYGRFGTRSEHHDEFQDMTMEGFALALEGALTLHADYPENRILLAAKRGEPREIKTPEEYPSLTGYGPELDYEGDVVRSCVHCHQVRDAERRMLREAGRPLTDQVLYPYPLPTVVGLRMDPRGRATIAAVDADTPAAAAGFQEGDELLGLGGQPLLSIADIQWVLHNADDEVSLSAVVRRGLSEVTLQLELDTGWRRRSDISWRPTTWDLRRMGTGGLVLKDLSDDERRERKLPLDAMALLITHVGQYNEHAAAKNAGFEKGDVIVAAGERSERMRETDFLAFALTEHRPGDRVRCAILRGGRRMTLELPMQ
jgi:hypothetical protein